MGETRNTRFLPNAVHLVRVCEWLYYPDGQWHLTRCYPLNEWVNDMSCKRASSGRKNRKALYKWKSVHSTLWVPQEKMEDVGYISSAATATQILTNQIHGNSRNFTLIILINFIFAFPSHNQSSCTTLFKRSVCCRVSTSPADLYGLYLHFQCQIKLRFLKNKQNVALFDTTSVSPCLTDTMRKYSGRRIKSITWIHLMSPGRFKHCN